MSPTETTELRGLAELVLGTTPASVRAALSGPSGSSAGSDLPVLATGVACASGVGSGPLALSVGDALDLADSGTAPVLVLHSTSPADQIGPPGLGCRGHRVGRVGEPRRDRGPQPRHSGRVRGVDVDPRRRFGQRRPTWRQTGGVAHRRRHLGGDPNRCAGRGADREGTSGRAGRCARCSRPTRGFPTCRC